MGPKILRVVLDESSASDCQSVDDDCPADELRHLFSPATGEDRMFVAKAHMTHGPPTAALGGWVLPGTPTGHYSIDATQGDVHTNHGLVVDHADEPAINVGTWIDVNGQRTTRRSLSDSHRTPTFRLLYTAEKGMGHLRLGRSTQSWEQCPSTSTEKHSGFSRYPLTYHPANTASSPLRRSPREMTATWMDPCHFLGQFVASLEVP